MKVAFIANLGNTSFQFCRSLREIGVEADLFITYKEHARDGRKLIVPSENPDSLSFPGKSESWIRSWCIHPRAKPFLDAKKKLKKYDVVHACTMSPIFVQFCDRPFFCLCNGSDLREYATRWKGVHPGGYLLRRAYRRSCLNFFVNCDLWTIKQIEKLGGSRFRYLPYVIDLDLFSPGMREKGDKFHIFAPSSLYFRVKGTGILVEALSRFIHECNHGPDVVVTLVEQGPDVEETKTLLRRFDIFEQIRFISPQPSYALVEEYRKAHIVMGYFMNNEEGVPHFPLVVSEAMACGKTVVSHTDLDIVRESLGEIPPVVAVDSSEKLLEALKYFYENRDELESRGMEGRAWVLRHNQANRIARTLKNCYEKTL